MNMEENSKVCYECLLPNEKLWKDKGTLVCPRCYHRRYGKKKFTNQNKPEEKPTLNDLKRKLEKKGWG